MSKVKRRIAPVLVVEDTKSNISSAPKQSVVYSSFLKEASKPNYLTELEERAVKLGYSRAKKPRQPKKRRELGKHAEYLNSFPEYAIEFLKLHRKRKESYYNYIKKHFDKGQYYDAHTKRFRRVK